MSLRAVGIRPGRAGLSHVLDQHAPARGHHHQPGHDDLQQRVHLLVGGRAGLEEVRHAIGTEVISRQQVAARLARAADAS